MKSIIEKFEDGGPGITIIIFIVILVIIGLIVKAFLEKGENEKTKSLIANFAWFALAWGYMGRTFGLILAFDKVAAAGDVSPSMMAGGLKMALIGPLMGLFAFIIARVGLIVLTAVRKNQKTAP
jgi:hypothetical protein